MKKWMPITKTMPNPITVVLLYSKEGDWEVGQRNRPGGVEFTVFHKNGNSVRRGITHYCQIGWPGEDRCS